MRHPYGPGDLMHYYVKRGGCPLLRSEAEYQDFQGRPWWDWGYKVLYPVFSEMLKMGFDALPERFQRCVKILVGGVAELEVVPGVENWDPNASRDSINKMLKRIGPDYVRMLKACYTGLRVSPCMIEVPAPASSHVV